MDEASEVHSLLKPLRIIRHVQQGEEMLWTQRDLLEKSDDKGENSTQDIANKLVRKGKILRKIHGYFGNLESRKCCLFLAGCKTTFTNIRLVRNDGRDSNIEEGAMMKTLQEDRMDISSLPNSDVSVFQRAYLCASYPVLCAPDPPSALTPSPIPPSKDDSNRFSLGDSLMIARAGTPDFLQDSGIDEAEDMSVVPAETLFELLRRAFRLNQQKFNQYESSIYFQLEKKDPSRILAEELVGQLAALENNSNPFYNPDTFMTPQGYDTWQRREFSHIGELMKKFWHTAYPQHPLHYSKTLQTVHDDYTALLHKLIRYESPYRKELSLSDPGSSSLLSSASIRLLREFGLRHGIGITFQKLVYLHYLTSHFEVTVWFIQHVCAVLTSVLDMLPKQGVKHALVKKEFVLFEECIKGLETTASSIIFRMKNLFPGNKPTDGLASTLELISITREALSLLGSSKVVTMKAFLTVQIENIFPTCYNEHKMVVMKDLKQNSQQLTPTLLNMMIGKLRDEVKDYKANYLTMFERFFNIAGMAAKSLYSCLMDDVVDVFQQRQDQAPRPLYIDKLILGLGYRLNQLDQVWSQYIPMEQQVWREWFQREQLHWCLVLRRDIQAYILLAISLDKYPMEKLTDYTTTSESQSSEVSQPRYRSISTKSITPSVNSAFSGLMSCQSTPVRQDSPKQHLLSSVFPASSTERSLESKCSKLPGVSDKYSRERMMDTQSLIDFEDDAVVTFAGVRPSSSLPDILSKSYDHHLDISRKNSNLSQLLLHIKEQKNGVEEARNEGEQKQKEGENIHKGKNQIQKEGQQIQIEKKQTEIVGKDTKRQGEDTTNVCDINLSAKIVKVTNTEESSAIELSHNTINGGIPTSSSTGKVAEISPVISIGEERHPVISTEEERHSEVMGGDTSSYSEEKVNGVSLDMMLEKNAQRNKSPSSQSCDSLKEEFQETGFDVLDTTGCDESDSDSDMSESSCNNFDFPKVSEIAAIERFSSATPCATVTVVTDNPTVNQNSLLQSITVTHNFPHVGETPASQSSSIRPLNEDIKGAESELYSHLEAFPVMRPVFTVTIPVSSAVIDLTVILQRLVGFGSTLCQTFYRVRQQNHADFEASLSSSEMSDDVIQYVNPGMRRRLYDKFLECICIACTTFADNMLCMDICGTTLSVAKKLAGPQMVEYLETQQKSDHIWGCRHDVKGIQNCFEFVNKKTNLLCDRYEQVTQEMCTRINNVSFLLTMLDMYHWKLQRSFDIQEDWQIPKRSENDFAIYKDYELLEKFSYNPDSDKAAVVETGSQRVSLEDVSKHNQESFVQSPTKTCHSHLLAVLRALSRTVAYKINLFVDDALSILLALRDSDVHVFSVLAPLTRFLKTYIELLREWLYTDNYRRVMECLWIFIVQDFEKELSKLGVRDDSEEHAKTLIQALIHLMKVMDNEGSGIRQELLFPEAEDVMFKLQLFSSPTSHLLILYRELCEKICGCDVTSTSSGENSLSHILHKMKSDLMKMRKCFTGKQLVSWIMQNSELFEPILDSSLSVELLMKERRLCIDIAEWFLNQDLILDLDEEVSDSSESDSDLDRDYPSMTIASATEHQQENCNNSRISTPTQVPSASFKDMHRKHTKHQNFLENVHSITSRNSLRMMRTPIHLDKMTNKCPSDNSEATTDASGNLNESLRSSFSDGTEFPTPYIPSFTPAAEFLFKTFADNDNNYYIISLLEEGHVNKLKNKHDWKSQEIKMLVEMVFEKKISLDFILGILYNRRKYDKDARDFFINRPKYASKFRKQSDPEFCEVS